MAKLHEVLAMLCPEVTWYAEGEEYENITWLDGTPAITKKEFTDGLKKVDTWKSEQDAAQATAKAAAQGKLAALGLTVEDLQALGL